MKALAETRIDPSVPEQLQTALAQYEALGYTPEQITPLAELSDRMEHLGIALEDMAGLVDQMQRLQTLGLDTRAAEALATAVELAGIPEGQRADVLAAVVEKGVVHFSLPALHAEREARRQDVQQLRYEEAQLQGALAAARAELIRVQQEEAATRERVGALQATATDLESAIAAAHAFEAFLRGLDPGDRLFAHVAKIAEIQQKHPGRLIPFEHILAESVRKQIREFLARISVPPSLPPTPMPGAADTPADR
jgi:hypothetical protein